MPAEPGDVDAPPPAGVRAFDLNIEKVLEQWTVAFALREVIANALDEHVLSGTREPVVEKVGDGEWRIVDFGRGLRHDHLTQKEDAEKRRRHAEVVGQFGVGLKDALAVFDRRGVHVVIRSRHGDISTEHRPKAGFPDVRTLHGIVSPPSDPHRVGTEVLLRGVGDADVEVAKGYFLRYSGDALLESTRHGEVLERAPASAAGRVYVKGLLVAEEPDFMFSYNITQPNAALRRALNRERSNVSRTAYSDRVKDILKQTRSHQVVAPLADRLRGYLGGRLPDELTWKDIQLHACRALQTLEKVVFVSAYELQLASTQYAEGDGYRVVVVPEDVARALGRATDLDGRPMVNLAAFQRAFNDSFVFTFVATDDLTDDERRNLGDVDAALALADVDPHRHGIDAVLVSETMRLTDQGTEIVGLWDQHERRIVIRRDQLGNPSAFLGTLLHEVVHATSGQADGTLAFEDALTRRLGVVVSNALRRQVPR